MTEINPIKNIRMWHILFHKADRGRSLVKTKHKHLKRGGVHLEIAYSDHNKLKLTRIEFRVARRFKVSVTASQNFLFAWDINNVKFYGSTLTLYGKQTTTDVENFLTDILLHLE